MTTDSQTDSVTTDPPPAVGVRRPWSDIPAHLRDEVGRQLGSPVASAVTQNSGFSPGVAARLRTADGRRAFVKGLAEETNPDSPEIYRAEVRVASALPENAPAPRLLGTVDRDGWILLVFEDVDGHNPVVPWRGDELDRVLTWMAEFADAMTPSPIQVPAASDGLGSAMTHFRELSGRYAETPDELADLDPWLLDHLDHLATVEEGIAGAAVGDTLAHNDIRADNLLLTPDRVVAIDWPWATTGPRWLDLLLFLPSLRMQGGPAPQDVFANHPASRHADPDAVTAVLTGFVGLLAALGRQPAPPGLPTLRPFQAAQARAGLAWLKTRPGMPR